MKFALIGRTGTLLRTGQLLVAANHRPVLVVSTKAAPEADATVENFEALAAEWSVPFVRTLSAERIVAALDEAGGADIGVSMNFAGILPDSLVSRFPNGLLNAHGGDLPRYRGNACQAWAILQGESHIGLCIHSMIGGELDSGDIIAEARLPIDLSTRIGEVWAWLDATTPELFLRSLDELSKNPTFVLRKQNDDPACSLRCYPRTADDGRIRWQLTAIEIVRLVNASSEPYAGAFFTFENRRVTVWRASLASLSGPYLAVPGQVLAIEPDRIIVATGDSPVALSAMSVDGRAISPVTLVRTIRSRFE